jgi:hypothetical protein
MGHNKQIEYSDEMNLEIFSHKEKSPPIEFKVIPKAKMISNFQI